MNFFCEGNTVVCMAGRVTLGSYQDSGGSPVQAQSSSSLSLRVSLSEDVLCQATFQGPHVAQVADMVPQILDELDLLVQVACPQEVAQVGHCFQWPACAG